MTREFKKIVKQIAQGYGVSPKEVYDEMQEAIDIGYHSPDPIAQALWKKVPAPSGKPTPEDVVVYLSKYIRSV